MISSCLSAARYDQDSNYCLYTIRLCLITQWSLWKKMLLIFWSFFIGKSGRLNRKSQIICSFEIDIKLSGEANLIKSCQNGLTQLNWLAGYPENSKILSKAKWFLIQSDREAKTVQKTVLRVRLAPSSELLIGGQKFIERQIFHPFFYRQNYGFPMLN